MLLERNFEEAFICLQRQSTKIIKNKTGTPNPKPVAEIRDSCQIIAGFKKTHSNGHDHFLMGTLEIDYGDIRIGFRMESLQGISVIFRSIQNNLVSIVQIHAFFISI